WSGAAGGPNWSNPNNWTPVLSIPPINELIANVEFNVDIVSPACNNGVNFDNNAPIPNPAYVLNLTLGAGCALNLQSLTHLNACSGVGPNCQGGAATFTQRGVLNAAGGAFNADFYSLPGSSQQVFASNGSAVDLGAQTAPLTFHSASVPV